MTEQRRTALCQSAFRVNFPSDLTVAERNFNVACNRRHLLHSPAADLTVIAGAVR